jgi:hypothetical protein
MRHLAARVKLVDGRPAPVLEACKRCREAATPQGGSGSGCSRNVIAGLVELMTARERITKLQERIDRLERHLALLEKQWKWTDDEVEDAREAANGAYRLAHAARAAVQEGED